MMWGGYFLLLALSTKMGLSIRSLPCGLVTRRHGPRTISEKIGDLYNRLQWWRKAMRMNYVVNGTLLSVVLACCYETEKDKTR